MDIHAPSPTNEVPSPSRWTRGNGGEAVPGVSTPLNADFWRGAMETAMVTMFHRLGAVSGRELRSGVFRGRIRFFYGRIASDFDMVLSILGRLPGVDPAALEQQLVGESMGITTLASSRLQPVVAAGKAAWVLATLRRTVSARTAATAAWWRASLARLETADESEAVAVFEEAYRRMPGDMAVQCLVAALHPVFAEQLANLARAITGDEATALTVISGVEVEESAMVRDLWALARTTNGRDGTDLTGFLGTYGFYAADEGELSTRAWREDRRALDAVIEQYRRLPEAEGPAARLSATGAAARAATERVRARASTTQRLQLRLLLRMTQRFTPLRETGKTLMLLCLDVARAAARVAGAELAAAGVLDDADDVFYLSLDELRAHGADRRERVVERKAQRAEYGRIQLPLTFHGDELPRVVDEVLARELAAAAPGTVLEGLGVSQGLCKGTARVVTEPDAVAVFEPGDVLVCVSTDPGWTPLLSLAGGVVLDIGSVLSHGAIVARELGVPCVANTITATTTIPDGSEVEVDGTAGRVTVVA